MANRRRGKVFIHDDWLLETPQARRLYHEVAEKLPIIDFHCHLSPREIAEDRRWENLAQIWLAGDHYKWRAMRTNGVAERYCTGDATDREKFQKWAETVPWLLRNPLYDWTHLELARYFGIADRLLGPETAQAIWDLSRKVLAEPWFSARGLIRRSNVALLCTTDDPVSPLGDHKRIAADSDFSVPVLPTWRADRALAVEDPKRFAAWLRQLEAAADVDIRRYGDLLDALRRRHDAFHAAGCRLSDHGLETLYAEPYTEARVARVFDALRAGRSVSGTEAARYKSALLYELAVMDFEKGWTQQFHLGALRNNNTRQFRALGPDTGFDSIGDADLARPLARFLDRLDSEGRLAKTILYNLNPRDNALLVTMCGNFQDGIIPGKMQFGSAWWFLDQRDGIERQLEDLSQMGLLSRFVGMVTDSRSFLSYARHEYFRRILCHRLGGDMARGRLPDDPALVGKVVRDVCYGNAARYFGFGLAAADATSRQGERGRR